MSSSGRYEVGSKIGGFEIIERPDPKDRVKSKFKVKCMSCSITYSKWSTDVYHIGKHGRPFGCKFCHDKSMRREDDHPALLRFINSYKYNAKSRGIDFNLSNKEFREIASGDCFYCNAQPEERKPPKDWQPSGYWSGVDRTDNSKGYSVENCVPCCRQCNWSKKDLTQEEFYLWVTRVISTGWYGVLG